MSAAYCASLTTPAKGREENPPRVDSPLAREAARKAMERERLVSGLAPEQSSVGEGHAEDKEDDADRGAVADAHARDAEEIEIGHHGVRGVERPAAGERHDH